MERVTFFFYGTLMDAAICARVTGMAINAAHLRPATLDGYKRVRVAEQHYPALVPSVGGLIEGKLLRNVPPVRNVVSPSTRTIPTRRNGCA